MIKLLSTKIVDLTAELVEEFATMPEWGGERPLRAKRLEFLRSRLDDGLFHAPRWACAWLGNSKYRMNGQHSSNMLLAAGPAFPRNMQAVIDEYHCDKEMDLCTLFSQFDSPESTRNAADVIGAHAGIHDEIRNIPQSILQLIIAGVVVHRSEGESSRYPAEQRGRLVHDNVEFIKWAINYVRRFEFHRPGVAGAMYATWERSHERTNTPRLATEFWDLVRDNTHPDPLHATHVLHRFLIELPHKKRDPRTGIILATHAIYTKCIHAWNAHRNGTNTTLKYHHGLRAPVAV